jgi:hypothetical protein
MCTAVAAGSLPTATLTGGPTTNLSFLYWIYMPQNPFNNGTNAYPVWGALSNVLTLGNSNMNAGCYSGSSGGILAMGLTTSAGTSSIGATGANVEYASGHWDLVTMTWDGATFRPYLNGTPFGAGPGSLAGTFTAPTKMFFGNYSAGGTTTELFGSIAKISATKAVLTPAQIISIYNVGRFGHL